MFDVILASVLVQRVRYLLTTTPASNIQRHGFVEDSKAVAPEIERAV
jgi:hypothetical protein